MREQLQEQERREAEFRQNLQQQRPTAAPPRPVPSTSLSTIGVDVPPQVLQVRTLLENPTRYHVVQKQKNQVRQYLHESFRGNGTISAGDGNVLGRNSVEGAPTSAPMIVQSAPPGPTVHHPKPQHPHLPRIHTVPRYCRSVIRLRPVQILRLVPCHQVFPASRPAILRRRIF